MLALSKAGWRVTYSTPIPAPRRALTATTKASALLRTVCCAVGQRKRDGCRAACSKEFCKHRRYIDTCQPQPNCTLDQHDATPYCTSTCAPRSARQYDDDKHRLRSVYAVGSSDIEDALSADGPVEATLSVFADFTYYKEGVYKHVAGDFMGKHAVRIVGWGTDPTAGAYWLVANSWSTAWGDRGYFKIARGTNECGFESEVVAGEF